MFIYYNCICFIFALKRVEIKMQVVFKLLVHSIIYSIICSIIKENDSLPIVIDEAFNSGGVHLIDLSVDYSDNVKNLISDLAEHEPVI